MIDQQENKPRVGVAAVIVHDNKVLLGRRLNPPMPGSWQLPGGWIRYAESPIETINRKVSGFAGMLCSKADFVTYTDNQFAQGQHSLTLYFQLLCLNPQQLELSANKDCSDWFWADWYDLPVPQFYPLQLFRQSGFVPFIGKK